MNYNNKDWIWKKINHEIKYKNDYISSKNKKISSSLVSLLTNISLQTTVFNENQQKDRCIGVIIITFNNNSNFNQIDIYVNDEYPFRAPIVLLNGIHYIRYYKNLYTKYSNFINKYNINLICPCCDSITCHWSPIYKIWDIIFEILRFEDSISKVYKYYIITFLNFDRLINDKIKEFVF